MKVCPLEVIKCYHHNVGCKHTFPRNNQEQHNKDMMEEHLMLTCQALGNVENTYQVKIDDIKKNAEERCKQLQMQLSNVTKQLEMLCAIWSIKINSTAAMSSRNQVAPVVFKIPDFANKKSNKLQWRSPQFYSHSGGYTMVLVVYAGGDSTGASNHISAYLHLVKGENDDKLTWPLKGKFIIKLLNQIDDKEHHPATLNYGLLTSLEKAKRIMQPNRLSTGLGQAEFINHVKVYKSTSSCQYYKDDCVFFEVRKY